MTGGGIGTDSNGYTLTNQTLIQGYGLIGSNAGAVYENLSLNNSGTVTANSSGNTLTIGGDGAPSRIRKFLRHQRRHACANQHSRDF